MKTLLKTTMIAFLLIAFSCSKDDGPIDEPQQVIPPATVTNMSPLSGPKTTVVTFTGTNFGEDINQIQVFFDDIEAAVQNVTDTQIQTIVPPRAYFGEVRLVINGTEFTGFNFNYEIVDIQVSTFAGIGTAGNVDGIGTNAEFSQPFDIAFDTSGNLYVSDFSNNTIREITTDGTVTTMAGDGTPGFSDGISTNAQFTHPTGLTIDSAGNVYVADFSNHAIRKITPSGVVSTFAGGTSGFADAMGINAQFNNPIALAIDNMDNIYVVDYANHKIRKVTPNGTVTTVAGSIPGFADGNSNNAQFSLPSGIAVDDFGIIYVVDRGNHKIRRIDTNGEVTTIAGSTQGFADGIGGEAKFDDPLSIAIDALGHIYISDNNNLKIRKINTNGQVNTIAGSTVGFANGTGANAQFNSPVGLIIDESFTLYIADNGNHSIRKITQE